MKKILLSDACELLKNTIESEDFLSSARNQSTAFTRNRKMPFCDIIYFMCSSLRRTVQRELEIYFKAKGGISMSRQAFAQSREKIKPEALRDLNDLLIEKFESEDGEIATYKGYRLFAVDGSDIDLPNNENVREHFGYSSNGTDKYYAKGLAMTAFDVLNKLTIFAELYSYNDSEKRRIFDIVNDFSYFSAYDKCIFLLDRGYPSFELFKQCISNNQNFLVRVSSQSLREINECNGEDTTIEVTRNNTTITLRIVNVQLGNGLTEKLVTNLPNDFSLPELKELYSMRWGVETNFNYLKNKELIECFTGESINAILQDFYAGILMLNVSAIAYREQEDVIAKNTHKTKHTYKPNKTQLIADIKMNWVKMMLAKNSSSMVFRELRLYSRIKKYAYADIPNRHFNRPLVNTRRKRAVHKKNPF